MESFEQVAKAASAAREKLGVDLPAITVPGLDQQAYKTVEKAVRDNLSIIKEVIDDNIEQRRWGLYAKIVAWTLVIITTLLGYYDNLVQIVALLGITTIGTVTELGKEVQERIQGYMSLKRKFDNWTRGAEQAINNCTVTWVHQDVEKGIGCLQKVNARIGDANTLLQASGEASEKAKELEKELERSW